MSQVVVASRVWRRTHRFRILDTLSRHAAVELTSAPVCNLDLELESYQCMIISEICRDTGLLPVDYSSVSQSPKQ